MTEKELIARRLAGAGYEELARLSGISEMAVWRMLRGKVPGARRKDPVQASVRKSLLVLTVKKGPREGPPLSQADADRMTLLRTTSAVWEGIERVTCLGAPYDYDPELRGPDGHLKPEVIAELDAKVAAAEAPLKFPGHWHKEKVHAGECLACDMEAGRPIPDWFEKSPDWFKPKKVRVEQGP